MNNTNFYDFMTVEDLREIIKDLPDDMQIVIPVIDENDCNYIYGFRKVRVAGVLQCESEQEREVFCMNSAMDGKNLTHQIEESGVDPDVTVRDILYGPNT